MTSPTQRAGADVPVYYITGHDWDFEEDPSPDERSWVRYTDYAALQARIAELEARNAASERDARRWKWVYDRDAWVRRKYAIGPAPVGYYVVSAEREGEDATVYPVRATLEEAIDAAIDAHAQGQAGEEK